MNTRSVVAFTLRFVLAAVPAIIASLWVVLPAHAQMPQLLQMPQMPGMRGATPADCARMEEAFRGGGGGNAGAGGLDVRAMIAAMGCRPAAAPAPEKTAATTDCARRRQALANLEDGDWLSGMPIEAARVLAGACREPAASPAEQRARAGWLSFGEGRFAESADAFGDAASQAATDAARVRYTIERGKSLLAAGRTAGPWRSVRFGAVEQVDGRRGHRQTDVR